MVRELKLKEITYAGKKAIMRAIEASGKTIPDIVKDRAVPVDVCEAAFIHGIEGVSSVADIEKLNPTVGELTGYAFRVIAEMVGDFGEKKS